MRITSAVREQCRPRPPRWPCPPARLKRAALLAAWAGTLQLYTPGAVAQEPGGLTLGDVVSATLEVNPSILLAAQQVQSARGDLLVAGAPFDLQLLTSGTASRVHVDDPVDATPGVQKQIVYDLGLERLFRNGTSLKPTLSLTRSQLSTWPAGATANATSVGLTANVPLLRDRGGAVSAAPERAASRDYEASRLRLRHATAQSVLAAVVAYWDYLSAQRRLEVLRASEERAQKTVGQTRVLVEAEERTPADLTQVLGNLAAKKVSRLGAEQALFEARQQLGLAIGLPPEEISRLGAPGTPFPAASGEAPPRPPAEEWVATALLRRSDLAAGEQNLSAAEILAGSSRNLMKPRLDLSLATGYGASGTGSGLDDLVGPLYRRLPNPNATLQLSLTLPTARSNARGRLLQSTAAVEQQRVAQADLRRRIASQVAVSCEALGLAASAAAESENAVRLLDATVLAEQRKFQLGFSTLFDVIQAQDGLTSGLLQQIQSQRGYAVAIATLRYEAGVLVSDGERPEEAASLLSPPVAPPPAEKEGRP